MNEQQFLAGIVRVLNASGRTVGAGFVVSDQLIATCAHVIELAKADSRVVSLAAVSGKQQLTAEVQHWRNSDQEDLAILRLLKPLPSNLRVLPLGTSTHITGHAFSTYGFPDNYPALWGYGKIGGSTTSNGCVLIQLADAKEITPGFSGAPVWDQLTHRIVGMVTARTVPERDGNGQLTGRLTETAFITPSQVLQDICPELRIENICPYVGLSAFTEESASFFYGRERLVEKLKENLRRNPRFLAVVGSSGSGKSSVVQAGLFPQLQHDQVPGFQSVQIIKLRLSSPLEQSLLNALFPVFPTMKTSGIGDRWSEPRQFLQQQQNRILIFIDQFEELFALYPLQEQADFITDLLRLLKNYSIVTVVITIRSDFYAPLQDSRLGSLLESSQVNVLGMSDHELRTVIAEPATRVGLQLEPGLVDLIVTDLRLKTTRNPLPLLEFTLEQLWNAEHRNNLLTCDRYLSMGRVTGAIAQWADETYHSLDEPEQALTRRIFTRLIHYGSTDIPDTRHRLPLTEFANTRKESTEIRKLINKLADARLLVTEQDSESQIETVEIIHDALITEWLELGKWIKTERVFLLWRQRLSENLKEWKAKGEKEGNLLYEAPLAEAEGYLKERQVDLNADECRYIEAGVRKRDRHRYRIIAGVVIILITVLITIGLGISNRLQQLNTELNRYRVSIEARLNSNQNLDVLVEAVKITKQLPGWSFVISPETRIQILSTLQKAIQYATELQENRWIGHEDFVSQVIFLTDGQTIVSASPDGTVKLWRRDGTLIKSLPHGSQIWAIALSTDEQTIASAGEDGIIKLWKRDGTLIRSFKVHARVIWSLQFSPNSNILASGSQDGAVKLWDLEGELLQTLPHSAWISQISFSPDGQTIASASVDGKISLWSLDGSLQKRFFGSSQKVISAIAFSPDGQTIVSGNDRGEVELWNLEGQVIQTMSHNVGDSHNIIGDIEFRPDGQIIATASQDGSIKLWSLNGDLLETLAGHNAAAKSLSFSPDGKTLVSGGYDKTIRLWNFEQFQQETLEGHRDWIEQISFSPDGSLIATGSRDPSVKFWTRDGILLRSLQGGEMSETSQLVNTSWQYATGLSLSNTSSLVSISSDGKITATSDQNNISFWDSNDTITTTIHGATINPNSNVEFSPDSKTVAWSDDEDNTVRIWSIEGQELVVLKGHTDLVRGISFSPDEKLIATASDDQTIKLWKLDGSLYREFPTKVTDFTTSINFSPNGQIIATSSLHENNVQLWDLDGNLIRTFQHDDSVFEANFSPDGKMIVAAVSDGTIKLWNLDGTEIKTFEGHTSDVISVDFSPNGQQIASASNDGTIKLWRLDGTEVISFKGHEKASTISSAIHSIRFSPDGKMLISSGGEDKSTKIWNLRGELQHTLQHREWPGYASFSPDGRMIVTNADNITLWRSDGEKIRVLNGHTGDVRSMNFDQSGRTLITASTNGDIKFWETDGTLVRTLEVADNFDSSSETKGIETALHADEVLDVSLSSDGEMLATASLDDSVKLWKMDGSLIATLPHGNNVVAVSFSPNGQLLASASYDKTVKIWDRNGKELLTLRHEESVNDVTFSPDNALIASASENEVTLWSVDGRLIETFTHSQPISRVSFSPDGKTLAVGSYGTVFLLNFDIDRLLSRGCYLIRNYLNNPNANLSREERHLCDGVGTLIPEGEALARNGDIESAISKFREALSQNPRLNFDPEAKAKWLAAPSLLASGENFAKEGHIEQAEKAYQDAQEFNPTLKTYPYYWSSLCWYGSLHGYASQVMDYCEKAIKTEPENGIFRDNRGLARARLGNKQGAIEDFEFFINWIDQNLQSMTEAEKARFSRIKLRRQRWIEALQSGQQPLTDQEIKSLFNE